MSVSDAFHEASINSQTGETLHWMDSQLATHHSCCQRQYHKVSETDSMSFKFCIWEKFMLMLGLSIDERLMFVKKENYIFNVKCGNPCKTEFHIEKRLFMPVRLLREI